MGFDTWTGRLKTSTTTRSRSPSPTLRVTLPTMNDSPAAHTSPTAPIRPHRAGSDIPFFVVMGGLGGSFVLLIVALLVADIAFTSPKHFVAALSKPEIQH